MTPTRAKETRCCRASQSCSSTTPMQRSVSSSAPSRSGPHLGFGDVPAYPTRPRVGLDLDERLQPQHPPRAVAANRHAGGREASATASAPRATAAASHGHPHGRHRDHPSVRRRADRAKSRPCSVPSTVPGRPDARSSPRQKTSPTSTSGEPGPAVGGHGIQVSRPPAPGRPRPGTAATRCAGRGGAAEVVVEGHDAVHVGAREVEHLGDDRHVVVVTYPWVATTSCSTGRSGPRRHRSAARRWHARTPPAPGRPGRVPVPGRGLADARRRTSLR